MAAEEAASNRLLTCNGTSLEFEESASFGASSSDLTVRHRHRVACLGLPCLPACPQHACTAGSIWTDAQTAAQCRLTRKQRALHIRRCAREQDELAVRAEPAMADSAITNDVKGKVAVVLRGGASFAEKAVFVQAAGAIGMVVANSEDALGRLVGTAPEVTIPYVA